MILFLQILASLLLITGLILNANKKILCWPVWITSNIILIYIHTDSKLYVLLLLQVTLIFINVIGWFKWKTN